MSSPRIVHRCILWPVLDDETGRVDYWEVHEPCPYQTEHITRRNADGTTTRAEIDDCCHTHEPAETATTFGEASALAKKVSRDALFIRGLDRAFGGDGKP